VRQAGLGTRDKPNKFEQTESHAFASCSLWIPREELDNPHKPKTWKFYREGFGVEILFETDPRTRRLDPAGGPSAAASQA
jgi:hypothetical protein